MSAVVLAWLGAGPAPSLISSAHKPGPIKAGIIRKKGDLSPFLNNK